MQRCMFPLYLHKYNVHASSGSPLKQKAFIVYVCACAVCDVIQLWSLTPNCAEAFPVEFAQKYAGIEVHRGLIFVLLCVVVSSHCSAPTHNGLITGP